MNLAGRVKGWASRFVSVGIEELAFGAIDFFCLVEDALEACANLTGLSADKSMLS